MGVRSDQRPLSAEEDEWLREVIADLINNFGLGPVKQGINRRPRPQEVGRPKAWDETRLF
jgi:hypothetical protein